MHPIILHIEYRSHFTVPFVCDIIRYKMRLPMYHNILTNYDWMSWQKCPTSVIRRTAYFLKFGHLQHYFLPNTKEALKKLPKTFISLLKWQNFAKSWHTGVAGDVLISSSILLNVDLATKNSCHSY